MCLPSDTDVRPQVGSYFGATLCTLDQGGVTVALLVGAPSHYDGRRGGRVHVYRWKEVRGAPPLGPPPTLGTQKVGGTLLGGNTSPGILGDHGGLKPRTMGWG